VAAAASGVWRAAEIGMGEPQMVLFLLLIIAAIALGIVGVVVKGLLFLLFIGAVVLIADLVLLGTRIRRSGRRPGR